MINDYNWEEGSYIQIGVNTARKRIYRILEKLWEDVSISELTEDEIDKNVLPEFLSGVNLEVLAIKARKPIHTNGKVRSVLSNDKYHSEVLLIGNPDISDATYFVPAKGFEAYVKAFAHKYKLNLVNTATISPQ